MLQFYKSIRYQLLKNNINYNINDKWAPFTELQFGADLSLIVDAGLRFTIHSPSGLSCLQLH